MLNIDDIISRNKEINEPIEIGEIRERIRDRFSNLEFVPNGHKYYLHKSDGTTKEMNSVSSVCHIFEPYVDWETILENKAIKLNKIFFIFISIMYFSCSYPAGVFWVLIIVSSTVS
jgi:hypothetical protein